MKICIIASLYDPYVRGGAEVIAEMIARECSRSHDVFVITTDRWCGFQSLFPRCEQRNGVRIYRFFPLNFFSFADINRKPLFLRVAWSVLDLVNIHGMLTVWHIMRKEQPDAVMAHALKGLTYGIALLLNALRIRWSYTPHDVQLCSPSGRLPADGWQKALKHPFYRLYRAFTARLFASPPLVVLSSQFLADMHAAHRFFPHSKKEVLCSPVPTSATSAESGEVPRASFIFAGQLEEGKGIRELLSAFLAYENPHARLSIMGQGRLENEVRAATHSDSRISFLGFCSDAEKFSALARHQYGVLPSKICENAPAFIGECMRLGIPVIAVAAGGAAELIRDGENGYVVARCDSDTLKDALARAAENTSYAEMATAARATVADLTIDRYVHSLIRLFEIVKR